MRLDEIKRLIGANLIEESIQELLKVVELEANKSYRNEIYLLSSKFQSLIKEKRIGTLNGEELERSHSQICNALLNISDKLFYEAPDSSIQEISQEERVGGRGVAEQEELTLVINKTFDEFSAEDQRKLLESIKVLLGMDQDVKIVKKKPGSVHLTLRLPRGKALELKRLVEQGYLKEYGVEYSYFEKKKEDRIQYLFPHEMSSRGRFQFDIYRSANDQLVYFNLKAPNGKVILKSESFKSIQDAEYAINHTRTSVFNKMLIRREKIDSIGFYFEVSSPNKGRVIARSRVYKSVDTRDKMIRTLNKEIRRAKISDKLDEK